MYGSQTPLYNGSRTPHYGSMTPSHGDDGSRTPGRSGAWDPTVALRQDLTGVQMVSEVTHGVTVGVTVGIMEVQAHGVHSEAAHGVAEEAHGLHIVGVNVGASDPHGGEKL